MKYLCIENKGEASPEAFLLMGASTKRSQDGQIGMFGTGWKYALAVLMREKIQVITISGEKRYTFGTEMVTFRDQEFERITVREGRRKPEPTQFTTTMGLSWVLSGALRELISNAFDEENAEVFVSGEIMNRPGYTRVYVQLTEAVNQIYQEFDRYFSFRRTPVLSGKTWAIYPSWGPGTRVYRRGVLVFEDTELPACFDYRDDSLDVREDRTAERYSCERVTAQIMRNLDLDQMTRVTDFLIGTVGDTFEGNNSYLDWYSDGMAENLKRILNGRILVSPTQFEQFSCELAGESVAVFPAKWVETFRKVVGVRTIKDVVSAPRLKGHTVINLANLATNEFHQLEKALVFAGEAGIEINHRKIAIFETESESAPLGYALLESGDIMINRVVLSRTIREIVEVLFEEFTHIDSQNSDYTRGFQNNLIRNWVKSLERFIPTGDELTQQARVA